MSGTVPTLSRGLFTIDNGLEGKPVFFLTASGQKLVVKGEAPGMARHLGTSEDDMAVSIKWSSKLMKNVNNKLVNTKILTGPEVDLFKAAALTKFAKGSRQRTFIESPTVSYQWVKMPMVEGLSDVHYFKEGLGAKPIPSKVKNAITKFSDEAIWPTLGKIIAVDIFNGNNDRFHTVDGDLVNPGNVLFLDDGDTSLIGLDTYDPNERSGNLNATPGGTSFEPLRVLNDGGRRIEYARKCTSSLGKKFAQSLGPGVTELTLKVHTPFGVELAKLTTLDVQKMYEPFAPTLAVGIERGADQLRTYLQAKVRKYRLERANPVPQVQTRNRSINPVLPGIAKVKPRDLPQGVWDRMVFLGWDV